MALMFQRLAREPADGAGHALGRIFDPGADGGSQFLGAAPGLVGQGPRQGVLVGEVVVEAAFRDVGRGHDVVDADSVDRAGREQRLARS